MVLGVEIRSAARKAHVLHTVLLLWPHQMFECSFVCPKEEEVARFNKADVYKLSTFRAGQWALSGVSF